MKRSQVQRSIDLQSGVCWKTPYEYEETSLLRVWSVPSARYLSIGSWLTISSPVDQLGSHLKPREATPTRLRYV